MQALSGIAGRHPDDLCEVFTEMRGHLYLHAGTLLLKQAQNHQHTWRSVIDLTTLCYLLAYQVWINLSARRPASFQNHLHIIIFICLM